MAHGRLQIMFDDEVRDDILTYPYHIAFTTNGEKGQPFVIRSATVTLDDPMNTSDAVEFVRDALAKKFGAHSAVIINWIKLERR
jgi:hypothetical protein